MPQPVDRLQPSGSYPLGAHFDGRGIHFAVYSGAAERVELCVFDAQARHETRYAMPECTDGVWHGYLTGAGPGLMYGYRAYGPYDPRRGLRFNGNKLLVDPYARRLHGAVKWHDALYGYRVGSAKGDLSFDRRDSAAYVPKAIVVDDRFDWMHDHAPRVPWAETVIYELHVGGFTRRRHDLPEHDRGTFGALGHATTIDYLKSLGVTAVELLPIHAFVRDRFLVERGLTNYWGYNTLAFLAPDLAYMSDRTLGQVKWAVRQLHAAGIEVILDVVYNHTCEGNELGPTLSLRGFGDHEYYRQLPETPRHHVNDTGCGNTLDFTHPRVIQLVLDSLRHWVTEYHVDGFRFDLGVTLGRETYGFDPGCGLFDAMLQDPLLARVKLISEAWDVGPGGYQVGNHPAGMAEWNDRFRDDLRGWWKGDAGLRGAVAGRLQGSAELFDHHRRRPWASINFVTAHDGFTLEDLVSYNGKHNEANGEDNRDGSDRNESWNWGEEGPTQDEAIRAIRLRTKRNLLATLLFSHGTPMLLAGDEFGQTQNGNNNAYCQDNEISWLDWDRAHAEEGRALREFVARLIALRRTYPVLQGRYFQHGHIEVAPGLLDIAWFDERGTELTEDDWNNSEARLLGLRRAAGFDDGRVEVLAILANADVAAHVFRLPEPRLQWQVAVDTSDPQRRDVPLVDGRCEAGPHSLILLVCHTTVEAVKAAAVPAPSPPVADAADGVMADAA
ncbi:MAG TPA: glycogen debranching protein GlgX [Nevskiaceae bacterium]|nr:glycogen debranching protein GlgX [Nevskiaceae bacterium]